MIKPLLKRVFLTLLLCFQGLLVLNAQTTSQEISDKLENDPRVNSFTMDPSRGTPSLIKMNVSGETLSLSDAPAFLQSVLGYGEETSFVTEAVTSAHGVQVDKLQQYTNGIKVEHGVFKALSQRGIVFGFTAEYYNLPASISSTPTLSEEAALQSALDHVGATTYAWELIAELGDSPEYVAAYEEVYPKGELVFVDNYLTEAVDLALAYKFNVYAAEPLSRADIYVDAASGDILLLDAIIKHADGSHTKEDIEKMVEKAPAAKPVASVVLVGASGDTRYAGNRSFDTSQDANGNWVLKGVTPTGVENETLSYEGVGGLPLSIPALATLAEPIVDGDGDLLNPETADNNWTAAEHRKDEFSTTSVYPIANEKNNDDVALDAHWGAEVVLNYWQNVHNRSSYDDKGTKVFNFVHYGDAYDNAFWNGSAMTYGDGSYQGGTNPDGSFAPLTSMDVCSHEIGHGVCEFTADLVYQRESGAMNEGFSDIWAAAVEAYVLSQIDGSLNYDPWGIGEQIDERDGGAQPGEAAARALRWMDDPKAAGAPDSYGGTNWINPECGTPTLANDQCGVHTNSGVLNKWYYLLVAGSGQSFSAGFGKQSADDQVNDAGDVYSVEGLGFTTASKITYLAETMLSPNAKFADMREASILAAQTLYGIGSNEEKQTTNAWHGVNVGEAYNTGEPNTITFSESNLQILSESNPVSGCEDFNTYSIILTGVDINPSASISLSTAGSTATVGEDFSLSASSLTFSGSETKSVDITVNDDAVIEEGETIKLSFVYNGQFHQQEFAISDDDFAPRTGSEAVDLLATETFSVDGFPVGWAALSLSDGTNVWRVNGDVSAAGRAYISDGITEVPFYNQTSPTNTILRSPLINAAAASNVTVSFDWEAGGETDAVDPSVIFDYGEFVYSLDGATYVSVKKFVGGGPLATVTASGSFSAVLNELDGKPFYLGWRWYNDTNAGSEFSFAIDNVKVSATPAGIASNKGATATTTVYAGNTIYFMNDADKALIAKIENASADLGCVTLSVIDEGSSFEVFSNISTARPSKAFSINTENAEATYDLTLYFTNEELSAFDAPAALIPMKVNSANIDDANDRLRNFQLNGVLTEVNEADQFRAYTGTFSGSGSVSIVQDFSYCTDAPAPWAIADVGSVGEPGTICYIDGKFELNGSGSGIGDKADAFYFTYQELTGDGELIARVNALENTSSEAKAAVMVRENLQSGSMFAMAALVANPNGTGTAARFEYRKTAGSKASGGAYQSVSTPEYIRIVRTGSQVSAYVSETNGNWVLLGSSKINFGATIYVGLATTSNLAGVSATAEFSDVSVLQGTKAATTNARLAGQESENERPAISGVNVFPNPAANTVTVEIAETKVKSVAIYNLLGELMKEQVYSTAQSRAELEVTELTKGYFVMKVQTEDGQIVNKKFFKE
ncbi:M4 family metallopeptidase [Nafulsella turpanensis]|uniref:M4 family metallopeptidase n=1 Tax=Nafulsella turpanensis TaxID=1265690 RepID=UPI00135F14CE|nr:M4 family metallopeptidase [Nafulsella turpanensis]